jgi:acetyltransferase-like isoleucine patch superfamily enzyme
MTLVINNVEQNTVVAGIPARTIRELGEGGRPLL